VKTKPPISFATLPTDYHSLVTKFPPRPIHDRVGLKNTLEIIDAMAGHALNKDQEDYLEILSRMVEDYEAETRQVRKVSGVQLLRLLVAEHNLTAVELSRIIGVDSSHAAKIIRGDRSITPAHAKKIARRFAVRIDALLR